MKVNFLKRFLLIIGFVAVFFSVAFANPPAPGSCTPDAVFWGTSCCTYTYETEGGGVAFGTKCCKYRFWIRFGCEETDLWP